MGYEAKLGKFLCYDIPRAIGGIIIKNHHLAVGICLGRTERRQSRMYFSPFCTTKLIETKGCSIFSSIVIAQRYVSYSPADGRRTDDDRANANIMPKSTMSKRNGRSSNIATSVILYHKIQTRYISALSAKNRT